MYLFLRHDWPVSSGVAGVILGQWHQWFVWLKADFMHKQEFLRHMSKSLVKINTHKHLDLASKVFFCFVSLYSYILIVISIFS